MGGGRTDRGGDRRDSRPRPAAGGDNKELLSQFNLLNAKLDRIISSLSPVIAKEVVAKAKASPAPVVAKAKEAKATKASKPAKPAKKKKAAK